MAFPTEIYVDPSIAANSGTGTLGDPYGDLQYALNTVTRDSTNGNRFNIKAGTSELLTAVISYATYGNPDQNTPLIFQGYTSTAGDGGIGVVSGNGGSYAAFPTKDYVGFKDLRITNVASNLLVTLGNYGWIENCEIDTTTASTGGISMGGAGNIIRRSYIHDVPGQVIIVGGTAPKVNGCYIVHPGTGSNLRCLDMTSAAGEARSNIIVCAGAAVGIYMRERAQIAEHNSILSSSGTGSGIEATAAGDEIDIVNNLIEGFSGSGGCGVKTASGAKIRTYGHNAFYNNATNESNSGDILNDLGDNESLGATPFAKSGSNTFANRFTYFAPADTGNVQNGAYPSGCNLDKGACQHSDPAGGSGGMLQGNLRGNMQ